MAGEPERRIENVIAFKKREDPVKILPVTKPDPDEETLRLRANVFALLFAALLVGAGWLLVQKLGQSAHMQNCMMSGRSNCAPISAPSRN